MVKLAKTRSRSTRGHLCILYNSESVTRYCVLKYTFCHARKTFKTNKKLFIKYSFVFRVLHLYKLTGMCCFIFVYTTETDYIAVCLYLTSLSVSLVDF